MESFGGARVDHVGIAVKSIAAARGFYEGLGMVCGAVEEITAEGVRVAMLSGVAGSRVELLEAVDGRSAVGRFVAKRGEGMHHVALRVANVDAELARMKAAGMRLANDTVRVGAGGRRYFFVHPASAGGVLVEIVG